MDEYTHIDISMLFKWIFTICFFFLTTLPQSHCQPLLSDYYSGCKEQSYHCGVMFNISYPFWGHNIPSYCGGGDLFNLTCQDDTTTIRIGSQDFTVLGINPYNYAMKMVPTGLAKNICSPPSGNTYWSANPFQNTKSVTNIVIFYNCSSVKFHSRDNYFTCGDQNATYLVGDEKELLNNHPELSQCWPRIQVPADDPQNSSDGGGLNALQQVLDKGFQVNYSYNVPKECTKCRESGGVCGTNDTAQHKKKTAQHQFSCFCPDGSYSLECPISHHKDNQWIGLRKVIIGVTASTIGGFFIGIIIFFFRFRSSIWQGKFWLTMKSNQQIEAFLKNHGAQTIKRYKFSDVKKMTNSFKVKLGQGGFGVVYKGKLLTGCLVAIKVLNPSKRNNEEFINEVASISKTSHVNIVTLLGFCLEGRKKALVYEFMPNGSLDKFIYKKEPNTTLPLSCNILYQIAIGIARGLEYLHKGCKTRILHFDIKPHNILLDENLCPKISDFGLAKLCPEKESIISMSDARGTMGYVAPEVWNRHLGGVSHRSDVYSYGMMLLEMVGGRKNINAEASHTSEIYFPHWVYKRLELGNGLRQDEMITMEENEIAKRITIVGLWCIQTFPNDRPTMSRVIEMLEGNMSSLEIPPKPMLSSPTRSTPESSIS